MSKDTISIGTFSGKSVNPFYPMDDSICIEDIAHALSMQCRFNGHICEFYSVAEHSLKVSKLLEEQGASTLLQMYGLLHDASEAYLADLPKPFKDYLDEYLVVEQILQTVIESVLIPGDEVLDRGGKALLTVADSELCLQESKEFYGPIPWRENLVNVDFYKPLSPSEAKKEFLERYYKLEEALYLEQR